MWYAKNFINVNSHPCKMLRYRFVIYLSYECFLSMFFEKKYTLNFIKVNFHPYQMLRYRFVICLSYECFLSMFFEKIHLKLYYLILQQFSSSTIIKTVVCLYIYIISCHSFSNFNGRK